jgi:phosphomannomutase / phosphoglucomutase
VDVPEDRKFGIVERAVAAFSRDHEVIAVDGARVLFDGGWGLLRASNTQPVLVLRYEARTEEQLEAIRATMEDGSEPRE